MSAVDDNETQAVLDTVLAGAKDLIPISPFRDETTLKAWLGRKIVAELRDKVPQRVWETKFCDLTGHSDTGINVEILSGTFFGIKAFLGGLIGMKSAGLDISFPVYSTSRVTIALGAGRVYDFSDFSQAKNVLVASARFTL